MDSTEKTLINDLDEGKDVSVRLAYSRQFQKLLGHKQWEGKTLFILPGEGYSCEYKNIMEISINS